MQDILPHSPFAPFVWNLHLSPFERCFLLAPFTCFLPTGLGRSRCSLVLAFRAEPFSARDVLKRRIQATEMVCLVTLAISA